MELWSAERLKVMGTLVSESWRADTELVVGIVDGLAMQYTVVYGGASRWSLGLWAESLVAAAVSRLYSG